MCTSRTPRIEHSVSASGPQVCEVVVGLTLTSSCQLNLEVRWSTRQFPLCGVGVTFFAREEMFCSFNVWRWINFLFHSYICKMEPKQSDASRINWNKRSSAWGNCVCDVPSFCFGSQPKQQWNPFLTWITCLKQQFLHYFIFLYNGCRESYSSNWIIKSWKCFQRLFKRTRHQCSYFEAEI